MYRFNLAFNLHDYASRSLISPSVCMDEHITTGRLASDLAIQGVLNTSLS